MTVWNHYFSNSYIVSSMNLFQGIMLWAIIALTLYALNGKNQLICFGNYPSLSRNQIRDLVNSSRIEDSPIFKDLEKRIQEMKNETPQIIMPKDEDLNNTEQKTDEQKEEIRG